MNKLKISLLAGALLTAYCSHGQVTNPAPYCIAQYDDGQFGPIRHYISNVTLASLNNTSGDSQFAAPHYVYYNNIAAPDLMAGQVYTLAVSHDPNPSTLHFVAVYIDYNHNNNFSDSGELVFQQSIRIPNITNPSITAIAIPQKATTGKTRMRVMVFEDDSYYAANATPCTADSAGYLDYGETEDYDVNIIPSTGVPEINKNTNFLYPNPAKGTLYINGDFIGAELTMTDVQGRIAKQYKITNTGIDITALVPGTYFARVVNKGMVNTQVITVEK